MAEGFSVFAFLRGSAGTGWDRCLVDRDELLGLHAFEELAYHLERHVVESLDPHAGLAHVELFARLEPRCEEPFLELGVAVYTEAVYTEEVEPDVMLLRRDPLNGSGWLGSQ